MKKTPLHNALSSYGPVWSNFGGYEMPMYFKDTGGTLKEHHSVREGAAIFDASHMGQFKVSGAGAQDFLERVFTNNLAKKPSQRCVYGFLCDESAGVIDDLIVYKVDEENFFVVVNAGKHLKRDIAWFNQHKTGDVDIEDVSADTALLALQGPKAKKVAEKLGVPVDSLRFMSFQKDVDLMGVSSLVSRTGYTGEDGFEFYVKEVEAEKLFHLMVEAGGNFSLNPAGLTARDTLRLEAGLMLSGVDLTRETTPLEAGLGAFTDLGKDFIGCETLRNQREGGVEKKLIGFQLGSPLSGREFKINGGDSEIGFVTSLRYSPTLSKKTGKRIRIGLGYVDSDKTSLSAVTLKSDSGKTQSAQIVDLPFVSKSR
ncbi:MAG: glycine cleavage system aminomethyltransferase GcvT [Candidatus Altiarchaeales archaeon]|nr:glycine cleavage system aminomethyltransferase GcvT [Candidatus Altiarchaeales archaeon]